MASQDASREMTQSRLVVSGIEFMSIGLEEDNKGKSKEQLYVTVSFKGLYLYFNATRYIGFAKI
jgi:hypothetical protein